MPTALTFQPITPHTPRKRWTRTEYKKLAGEVAGYELLELVDGDLVNQAGKNRAHVIARNLIFGKLIQAFEFNFVNQGAPIDVAPEDNPTNEPQPDLIVLKRDQSKILRANPQPADLHLAVEIADSTLNFDLSTKARLYARVGLPDYWVFDLESSRMLVHRDPLGGRYASAVVYGVTESLAPLAAPDYKLRSSDLLPR